MQRESIDVVRVQVFCYALSPSDGSEWRQRIEAESEHFIDVSQRSAGEIAGQISVRSVNTQANGGILDFEVGSASLTSSTFQPYYIGWVTFITNL